MRDVGSISKGIAGGRRWWRVAAVGVSTLALMGAAGCNADEPASPTVEPLRQIDIPADFTFSMTRGVQLRVAVDAALALHAPLSVQVSLPSGGKLYEGPVEAGSERRVEVLAPLAAKELVVALHGRAKHLEQRAVVDGAVAQVELR
jgi:hypothetical protein